MRSPNSTSVENYYFSVCSESSQFPNLFPRVFGHRCAALSSPKKTLSSSKMASFSTLLLPSGVSFSKRAWSRNHANKIPSFEVCCFAAEPGAKLASANYGSLPTRRSMFGLIFGISTLGLSVFDANGAGLPPEEKPRLCDDSCEKELENVPMVTTESGLQYKDIQVGQGPTPPVGFQVAANYVAMVQNGQIFDSSLEKGVPYIFRVGSGQVIKGLDEGILSMKIGGKRRLYIPGSLAFPKGLTSAPGRPRVAPNSPVIFDVSLEYIPGLEADDE